MLIPAIIPVTAGKKTAKTVQKGFEWRSAAPHISMLEGSMGLPKSSESRNRPVKKCDNRRKSYYQQAAEQTNISNKPPETKVHDYARDGQDRGGKYTPESTKPHFFGWEYRKYGRLR